MEAMFPHRCHLTIKQVEIYDCIAHMYLGKDIFSTSFFRHEKFDEQIDQISGHILIQTDKHEHVMISCSIFKRIWVNIVDNRVVELWTVCDIWT
jgi:hypothetical protein